jgi:uncharacterized protein (TIGR03083 family)
METVRMTPPEIEAAIDTLHAAHRELLAAVDSVADDAWDEPSPDAGWTYRDVLAHVASNELRVHARLRSVFGQTDEAELRAINDIDGWNQREVETRRGRSVPDLVDELATHRRETLRLLAGFRPEHLSTPITMADASTCNVLEYIEMFTHHVSEHAGQLVPASHARRSKAP